MLKYIQWIYYDQPCEIIMKKISDTNDHYALTIMHRLQFIQYTGIDSIHYFDK